MENSIINEDKIKEVIYKIINEDVSKISRNDFNRVQFKLDELQNSLNETIKEFRQVEDSMPYPLKNALGKKISSINSMLYGTNKAIIDVKQKVRDMKKANYTKEIEEVKTKKK